MYQKKIKDSFKFNEFFAKNENTIYAILDNSEEKKLEIYPFSSETNLQVKSIILGKKTKIYVEADDSLKNLKKPIEFSLSDGKNIEQISLNLEKISYEEKIS